MYNNSEWFIFTKEKGVFDGQFNWYQALIQVYLYGPERIGILQQGSQIGHTIKNC